MNSINHRSDFKLLVEVKSRSLMIYPFTLEFFTTKGGEIVEASYDGSTYKGCSKVDDNHVIVPFDSHELSPGRLRCRQHTFIPDPDFPDGVKDEVTEVTLDVDLVCGASSAVEPISVSIAQTILKPVKGVDYFTAAEVEDFTSTIGRLLLESGNFRQDLTDRLIANDTFINAVAELVAGKPQFINSVTALLVSSDNFAERMAPLVEHKATPSITTSLTSSTSFINAIATKVAEKIRQ